MDTDRKKRLKKKKTNPEKENIICVHGNWVKFSAAKNGLGKKKSSQRCEICASDCTLHATASYK